jgi:predicted Zn-dependent protease
VLAHELAHVTEKHGFRGQVAAAGPFLVFQVFYARAERHASAAGCGSALLVAQSFSQEYEKEADDVGWDYMVKANIDPRGMIDVFRKLQAYEMKHEGKSILPRPSGHRWRSDRRLDSNGSDYRKIRFRRSNDRSVRNKRYITNRSGLSLL